MNIDYPSIAKFQQLVELKDYKPPTKKEYVRHVRRLADHFHCDPATLIEDQVRTYFLLMCQGDLGCGKRTQRIGTLPRWPCRSP